MGKSLFFISYILIIAVSIGYSDDENMKGRIAKIIKPGYLYVIDDETTKVVRPAQVKLFE